MGRYFLVKTNIHTDVDAGDASTRCRLATMCLMSLLGAILLPKSSIMNWTAPNMVFLTQYTRLTIGPTMVTREKGSGRGTDSPNVASDRESRWL
jgi:hypothetical protein